MAEDPEQKPIGLYVMHGVGPAVLLILMHNEAVIRLLIVLLNGTYT